MAGELRSSAFSDRPILHVTSLDSHSGTVPSAPLLPICDTPLCQGATPRTLPCSTPHTMHTAAAVANCTAVPAARQRRRLGCRPGAAAAPGLVQALRAQSLPLPLHQQHQQHWKQRQQQQQQRSAGRHRVQAASGGSSGSGGSGSTVSLPSPAALLLQCPVAPVPLPSWAYHLRSFASLCSHATPTPQIFTLPTMLTLARVAAIPALVAAWYSTAPWAAAACTTLFVGASLTDYLDGYLARKLVSGCAGCGCGLGCWFFLVQRVCGLQHCRWRTSTLAPLSASPPHSTAPRSQPTPPCRTLLPPLVPSWTRWPTN